MQIDVGIGGNRPTPFQILFYDGSFLTKDKYCQLV